MTGEGAWPTWDGYGAQERNDLCYIKTTEVSGLLSPSNLACPNNISSFPGKENPSDDLKKKKKHTEMKLLGVTVKFICLYDLHIVIKNTKKTCQDG